MPDAFFVRDGEVYLPTELTRGPWDEKAQHGGPPAALVARAVEALPAEEPRQVARITYEILRPVPIAPLRVRAAVMRPGRRVELVEAALADDEGDVITARAWRIRIGEADIPAEPTSAEGAPRTSEGATLRPGTRPQEPEGVASGEFVVPREVLECGHRLFR